MMGRESKEAMNDDRLKDGKLNKKSIKTARGGTLYPGANGQEKLGGRPKGSRSRSTIVREWLEAKFTKFNPITGKEEHIEIQDHLVVSQIIKAMDGDTVAFKELFDSGHGKLTDKVQSENKTELDIDLSPEDARKIINKLKDE